MLSSGVYGPVDLEPKFIETSLAVRTLHKHEIFAKPLSQNGNNQAVFNEFFNNLYSYRADREPLIAPPRLQFFICPDYGICAFGTIVPQGILSHP